MDSVTKESYLENIACKVSKETIGYLEKHAGMLF